MNNVHLFLVNIPWDMLKSIVHRESENDGLDNIRFELYSYVFHNSFDGVKLFKLDSNFIPLLACLAFLIKVYKIYLIYLFYI